MKVVTFLLVTVLFYLCHGDQEKRILMSDPDYVHQLEVKLQTVTATVADLSAKLTDLTQRFQNNQGAGGVYTRWGRTSCPSNTSELVYEGYVGSGVMNESGYGANSLCMASAPEIQPDHRISGYRLGPRISSAEYYLPGETSVDYNDDAPCAVCRSHKASVVMVPGRRTCHPGWTVEYTGYIVAGNRNSLSTTSFLCLDDHPEAIPNSRGSSSASMKEYFEPATAFCGGLACPPYKPDQVILCVVCSK